MSPLQDSVVGYLDLETAAYDGLTAAAVETGTSRVDEVVPVG